MEYYKKANKIPIGNYVNASEDIRYMLTTKKNIEGIKLSRKNKQLLIEAYADITQEAFGESEVVELLKKIKVTENLFKLQRLLFLDYYTLTSKLCANSEVGNLLKSHGYTLDYRIDQKRLNKLERSLITKLKEYESLSAEQHKQKEKRENYIDSFDANIVSISKFLGFQINEWEFTLGKYLATIKEMKDESTRKDSQ